MKTFNLTAVIFILVLFSCNSGTKTNGHKVTFGIYETVKISDMPNSFIDTLKSRNVTINNNQQQAIIGYITNADTSILGLDLFPKDFKLVRTYYPVDKDKKYYAILAIAPMPALNNAQIKKATFNGNNVKIFFNMKGAKKWADVTGKNIGKTLAFVIDNQVYDMPEIDGKILEGVAFIKNLKSETLAKNIAESLNSSIPN